jgi:hypothetical protein
MKEENIKVIQYMLVVLLLNVPVMWLVAGYMATTYMIIASIIGYICVNGDELRKFFLHYSQKYHSNRRVDSKRDSLADSNNKDEEEGDGISTNRRD